MPTTAHRPLAAVFPAGLLLAGLLLASAGCKGGPPPTPRDYFVSPRGDDATGVGSAERPFKSIDRANRLSLHPGDRLLFEGGQTFRGTLRLGPDDAGMPGRPVTVGSFGAGRATIAADGSSGVVVEDAGGVRVIDLVVVGNGPTVNDGSGVEFTRDSGSWKRLPPIEVANVEARGFGRAGVRVAAEAGGYDGVRVTDCAARGNAEAGIHVDGRQEMVDDRACRYSHRDVVVAGCLAADNPGDPRARHVNHSGSGILIAGTDGGTIERCEATRNGAASRGAEGGPIGIWATGSTRVTIRLCRSHANRTNGRHDGGGFALDGGVTRSVMEDNVSEANDGSGFGLYQYEGAPPASGNVVRRNVSRGDGRRNGYAGVHVWDGDGTMRDVLIERNRVEAGGADAWSTGPARALWVQTPVVGLRVTENAFVARDGARLLDVAVGPAPDMSRNTYAWADGGGTAIVWRGTPYATVAQWRAATGLAAAE
ncbi:MAG TPA: right-handed parallel beta-helix repeat-containing protein [Humisphaera sp.]